MVTVIHADDMWYPTKLEKQMAFLEQHSVYCILGTWYDYVDINDKVIGTAKEPLTTWENVESRYKADKMVVFCHPSVVFSHDVALAVGGFHEEFWPTDDADMWQRMLETGGKACIYPEVLTMYRIHNSSTTFTRMAESNAKRRYTEYCMHLRRSGRPEISFEEYMQLQKKRPEALVKISPFVWPIVYNDSMRIDERQKRLDIRTFWKERWFGLKKMLKCYS